MAEGIGQPRGRDAAKDASCIEDREDIIGIETLSCRKMAGVLDDVEEWCE
jgi:hypothetical protein